MSAYTSEPWVILDDNFGVERVWANRHIVINGVSCGVELVSVCALDREDAGPLICAAPELLKTLKRVSEITNCTCKFLPYIGQLPPCDKCKIDAVIAKAEGR